MDEGTQPELGQLDLLLSRIEIHRNLAKVDDENGEPAAYHAQLAAQLSAEVEAMIAAYPKWKLEALEAAALTPAAIEAWTTEGGENELAVAELDISDHMLTQLDEREVVWVRQLIAWTSEMVLLLPDTGEVALARLQKALADRGLKLRDPEPGEKSAIPTAKYRLNDPKPKSKKRPGMKPKDETKARRRGMLRGLADGVSYDELRRQWNTNSSNISAFRQKLRERVKAGEHPVDIAKSMGFVHSQVRARVVSYLASLAE